MKKFNNVIVRRPCKAICDGITSGTFEGTPDYENALKQHDAYIEALKKCGVEVTVLPALDEFPDEKKPNTSLTQSRSSILKIKLNISRNLEQWKVATL